jgi:hypothetical protein
MAARHGVKEDLIEGGVSGGCRASATKNSSEKEASAMKKWLALIEKRILGTFEEDIKDIKRHRKSRRRKKRDSRGAASLADGHRESG